MTKQPAHDSLDRTPFWTVQSVFDPDGGGSDFAYTIGLHDRGLPELHIWARPDRGEDPGEDWMLSMHDRTILLNELAWQLIDGELSVGQTLTRTYDAGAANLALEICAPGDREALQAFGVDTDAVVWPIAWSLTRPAEAPLSPLSHAALARAEDEYRLAIGALDPQRRPRVPPGWRLPEEPSFDPEQPFGPRTSVVLARAAQLWQADVTDLNCLLHAATHVQLHGSLTFPISVARTTARRVGRRSALERLDTAAREAVTWLTQGGVWRARWAKVLESLWGDDRCSDQSLRRATESALRDVVSGCLAVEAVADVIDEEWLVAGRGPWFAALSRPVGELPGPEWAASTQVIAAVADLLRPLTAQQLGALARLHEVARSGRVEEWGQYPDVFAKLNAWSVTGAAGCPWDPTLSSLPGWTPWLASHGFGSVNVELAPLPQLQEWASCVTAALTHRARLSVEDVEGFVNPVREVLPGLTALLNDPIAQAS